MNERGVEVLVKAALDGVKQARGMVMDGDALCAYGVLWAAIGRSSARGAAC